eukprot:scaffold682_cov363-Pavlova_lutheri.AAC.68
MNRVPVGLMSHRSRGSIGWLGRIRTGWSDFRRATKRFSAHSHTAQDFAALARNHKAKDEVQKTEGRRGEGDQKGGCARRGSRKQTKCGREEEDPLGISKTHASGRRKERRDPEARHSCARGDPPASRPAARARAEAQGTGRGFRTPLSAR